ncbi:DUF262 domain-containing protein [Gordonia sp. PKS22-38]|uniref:DUF262 domain-containing protein n=1 Tax=Gordonia prachuapensis TaxID=3115651 RepID=A0ABU7MXK5_9ACTN|nr:DUF262 domain-containing protein [Gordonia sp. PKS22-38]
MRIDTEPLREITVSRFLRMIDVVDLNPPYQREGGVWSEEARSVLIDSIINGLDVPKLYFEAATSRRKSPRGLTYQYAVLDGKQRLETILAFVSDELALPDDFMFFEDNTINARKMTLSRLQQDYPLLARRFLDFEIPIVRVTSDSGDLVEEMFQRLNSSTALNAAEKRNALSGPTRDAANALAEHSLLQRCSPIRNARYKYRELGAKFLAIELQLSTSGRILDTKANTLYKLFVDTRGDVPRIDANEMEAYRSSAEEVLDRMKDVFDENDWLLSSIGTVVVYYIAFRKSDFANVVDRDKLVNFEVLRKSATQIAEYEPSYNRGGNVRLREYNAFVQSTNDGRALTRRAEILDNFVKGYDGSDPLSGLDTIPDGELPETDEDEP